MMLVALVKSNDAGGTRFFLAKALLPARVRLRNPPLIKSRSALRVPPQMPSSLFTTAHSKHSALYGHSPHSLIRD